MLKQALSFLKNKAQPGRTRMLSQKNGARGKPGLALTPAGGDGMRVTG